MNVILQKIEHFIFGTNKTPNTKIKSNREIMIDELELTDFDHSPFIPSYFRK